MLLFLTVVGMSFFLYNMFVYVFNKLEIKAISDVMQIFNKYFRSGIFLAVTEMFWMHHLYGFTCPENC